MVKVERFRYANPQKKRSRVKSRARAKRAGARSSHRARKNPAALALGFMNPHRRTAKMAKAKKRSRKRVYHNATRRHSRRRTRKNPFMRMRHHHRRRRNPGNMVQSLTSILISGFYALIGLVVARQVPQWALGANNTGWIGYGANLLTTIIAAWLAARMLGFDAGKDVAVGGGLYTVNRFIQDQLSPVGKVLSISGLGDYNALGDIQPGYFPLPVPTDANGQPIIPAEIRATPAAAAAMAAPKPGMSGIARSSRYTNRF